MNTFMHPTLPIANIFLWFAVVFGVLLAVAACGCVFIILVEPCVQRRRYSRAARVAARFNSENDTAVLLSTRRDSNYP
ncbi:uncharacterized protein CELE_R160.6 [Caenorhabditis elegans]|uniref:Transmembrane protein n=1 Tax=Caenorhabditis elegans TaxID=6239 RepID=Q9TZD2_CAEEL|nr:Transmembrane protein [Caenorhabditis elegans]CCD68424.2 Transmembrane protein [Caenorhabditis elegans]